MSSVMRPGANARDSPPETGEGESERSSELDGKPARTKHALLKVLLESSLPGFRAGYHVVPAPEDRAAPDQQPTHFD